MTTIRAVVDTSVLVPPQLRADLQRAAMEGGFTAIWTGMVHFAPGNMVTVRAMRIGNSRLTQLWKPLRPCLNCHQVSEPCLWTPWIIAELNRVLVWRWIKDHTNGDLSAANERRSSQSAKKMMALLLAAFEVVNPRPPYPEAWQQLSDIDDYPSLGRSCRGNGTVRRFGQHARLPSPTV